MLGENQLYLGEKRVEVRKLTPKVWKEVFGRLDKLPGVIMQVMLAPKEDFYGYVISACDLAIDEVVELVSVLSGLDKKYISEKVGLDEIVMYLVKTIKKNNLNDVIKNVKSLLLKETE